METVDVFLTLGEKIQELIDSGNDAFFEYFGHIDKFSCTFYFGKWAASKEPYFYAHQAYKETNGDFVQKVQNAANLLMLKTA